MTEATSDSTPAGAGPEQHARPYTPTPRTDKEARWGRCEAPDGSGFHESYFIPANLGRQLECELAVTRASETMYIARTQRAEYDLAKANTRADAEVTFRRYYGNQLANERKARADDNAVHSGMLTSARQRAEVAESCAALAEVNLSKQEDAERREAQHLAAIEVWQREAQSAQADAAQMFEQTRERCVRELWELGIPEDAAPIKVLRALQPEPGQGEKL